MMNQISSLEIKGELIVSCLVVKSIDTLEFISIVFKGPKLIILNGLFYLIFLYLKRLSIMIVLVNLMMLMFSYSAFIFCDSYQILFVFLYLNIIRY